MELPDMHVRDLVGIGHHFLPSEPTKWNVEDVYEFIHSLPGRTPSPALCMQAVHGWAFPWTQATGNWAADNFVDSVVVFRVSKLETQSEPNLPHGAHLQEASWREGGHVFVVPPNGGQPLCLPAVPLSPSRPIGMKEE